MPNPSGPLVSLIWFSATFVALVFLQRWLIRHLAGLTVLLGADDQAVGVAQFLLFLPGIVVHELSHWGAAKVLGVRTGRISIWPKRQAKGRLRMGSVQVQQVDPLRSSLIGLAPFLVASVLVLLVGRFALHAEPLRVAITQGEWRQVPKLILLSLRGADSALWVYLVFALSNSMFPSESDRSSWRPTAIYLAVAAVLFYVAGLNRVVGGVGGVLSYTSDALTYALTITLAVDILFALLIAVLEILVSRLRGRRVKYD
jgi:hypothetical protein